MGCGSPQTIMPQTVSEPKRMQPIDILKYSPKKEKKRMSPVDVLLPQLVNRLEDIHPGLKLQTSSKLNPFSNGSIDSIEPVGIASPKSEIIRREDIIIEKENKFLKEGLATTLESCKSQSGKGKSKKKKRKEDLPLMKQLKRLYGL